MYVSSLFLLPSLQPSAPSQELSRTQVRQLDWGKVTWEAEKTGGVAWVLAGGLKEQGTGERKGRG